MPEVAAEWIAFGFFGAQMVHPMIVQTAFMLAPDLPDYLRKALTQMQDCVDDPLPFIMGERRLLDDHVTAELVFTGAGRCSARGHCFLEKTSQLVDFLCSCVYDFPNVNTLDLIKLGTRAFFAQFGTADGTHGPRYVTDQTDFVSIASLLVEHNALRRGFPCFVETVQAAVTHFATTTKPGTNAGWQQTFNEMTEQAPSGTGSLLRCCRYRRRRRRRRRRCSAM